MRRFPPVGGGQSSSPAEAPQHGLQSKHSEIKRTSLTEPHTDMRLPAHGCCSSGKHVSIRRQRSSRARHVPACDSLPTSACSILLTTPRRLTGAQSIVTVRTWSFSATLCIAFRPCSSAEALTGTLDPAGMMRRHSRHT